MSSNENELIDDSFVDEKVEEVNGDATNEDIEVDGEDVNSEDSEMDEADNLLEQLASGKAVKRPSSSEMDTSLPPKAPRLAEDEFMGRFGALKENFYTKRIDVSENCIHEVCEILLKWLKNIFINAFQFRLYVQLVLMLNLLIGKQNQPKHIHLHLMCFSKNPLIVLIIISLYLYLLILLLVKPLLHYMLLL